MANSHPIRKLKNLYAHKMVKPKKQFLSFLLLISFALSIAAQKTEPVEQNLRRDVAYLASDALDGRRTGEQGATVAAGYIANLFAQYKLKAGISTVQNGKTSRNYLQKFLYTTGVEIAPDGNEFKLDLKNVNAAQLQTTQPDPVRPLIFSPNAEAENAPVVFAGYGIESAESNFNDYAELNVAGAIVLAFDGSPENDLPRSPFSRFTVHAKAKLAKDKGALGLLLISREDKFENDRYACLKYDQTQGETAVPVFSISRAAAANILGLKLTELKTIEALTAMKKDTTARVTVGFRDLSPRVSFKVNMTKKQSDAYNVVGILEGTDAALKNEAIVIGAHYDHLGKGGQGSLAPNSTEIHRGADDNASGTAALLELARQFAKAKNNKRTIIFIAFGGEEEGLLGSKHYINNPLFPLDKTVAMINMDMVGRLQEDKLTVGGIGTASEWKGLVEDKNTNQEALLALTSLTNTVPQKPANNSQLPLRKFALQLSEEGFGPSDHSSFYGKQIPVLFFFTGTHADYHKPTDSADKINYDGLAKITGYVRAIVDSIDRNPARPTYKVAAGSSTGGRTQFNVTIGVVPGYGDSSDGMLLDGVRDGSPAAIAGLKAGDKVVKFAGKEIRNVQDYTFVLGELKADTEYEIEIIRGGQRMTLKVKPAARK